MKVKGKKERKKEREFVARKRVLFTSLLFSRSVVTFPIKRINYMLLFGLNKSFSLFLNNNNKYVINANA